MPARLRVLIVDDNRDAADTLAALLELQNYECRVEYDGIAGLKAATEQIPDCLITDIRMPGLDGYSLAKLVRAAPTLAGVKLVALSAYTDAAHKQRAVEAGFDYTLVKAGNPSALEVLKMIEEIKELATKTRDLAQQNVDLAGQTKELIREVKEEIQEVKEDVQELKQDVKDLKDQNGEKAGD
jgi:CheY-like chemotaxis protein